MIIKFRRKRRRRWRANDVPAPPSFLSLALSKILAIISANPIVISLTTNYPRRGILILRPEGDNDLHSFDRSSAIIKRGLWMTWPFAARLNRRKGLSKGQRDFHDVCGAAGMCDSKFYWNAPRWSMTGSLAMTSESARTCKLIKRIFSAEIHFASPRTIRYKPFPITHAT